MPKNVRRFEEKAVVPPTIPNVGQIYVKAADGLPYFLDSSGLETMLLAGIALTVAETEVFNEASPNPSAWTDLNISAVVGANIALVVFKVYNPNGAVKHFAFRKNGETELTNYGLQSFSAYQLGATSFGVVICLTDVAGIVEWIYSSANEANTTIDVIAYSK